MAGGHLKYYIQRAAASFVFVSAVFCFCPFFKSFFVIFCVRSQNVFVFALGQPLKNPSATEKRSCRIYPATPDAILKRAQRLVRGAPRAKYAKMANASLTTYVLLVPVLCSTYDDIRMAMIVRDMFPRLGKLENLEYVQVQYEK